MTFKTQFDSRNRVFTNPGDPIKITYAGRYDEKGRVVLEEKGKENLYDEIQSHADSVNINLMLKRFADGEVDVFSKVQGFYGDITSMPTNFAESLNHIRACEDAFDSLPVEVRAKFNHNFTEFLASAGSSEFFAALGMDQTPGSAEPSPAPDVVKKEVSEE